MSLIENNSAPPSHISCHQTGSIIETKFHVQLFDSIIWINSISINRWKYENAYYTVRDRQKHDLLQELSDAYFSQTQCLFWKVDPGWFTLVHKASIYMKDNNYLSTLRPRNPNGTFPKAAEPTNCRLCMRQIDIFTASRFGNMALERWEIHKNTKERQTSWYK